VIKFFNSSLQRLAYIFSPIQPVRRKDLPGNVSAHHRKLSPRKNLILCPSTHSPLDPPNFTVTTFIEGCFCSNPDLNDAAADFLRRLPACDVVVWTDGSVRSPLGVGGAVFTRPAEDSYPPLHYPTQLSQSLLASPLSALHWYMAWNGVNTILRHVVFNRSFSKPTPNRPLPFSPRPKRFPSKVLLGYLGPLRLPLLPRSTKLPVGPRSSWTSR